jgi:hypothetical protein
MFERTWEKFRIGWKILTTNSYVRKDIKHVTIKILQGAAAAAAAFQSASMYHVHCTTWHPLFFASKKYIFPTFSLRCVTRPDKNLQFRGNVGRHSIRKSTRYSSVFRFLTYKLRQMVCLIIQIGILNEEIREF